MSTPPVPQPESPRTPGQFRASDADRDLVAQLLGAAYTEGRLTRLEHDERLDAAMNARTFDDLAPLTADLAPGLTPQPALSVPQPGSVPSVQPDSGTPEAADTAVAVFSGTVRRGPWRVRKHTSALAVFGGVDLDMREAQFTAPVVEVNCWAMFGGIDIIVPDGVTVQNDVMGIFGGSDTTHIAPPQPGAPRIVVKGLALFGGVDVKGNKSNPR